MRLTSIDWRALTDPATLQRRIAQAPTFAWVALALVPPLVAGGLWLAARQVEQRADAQRLATRSTLADLRAKAAVTPPSDASPFAARLPLTQSSARAVTHLREAAEGQSVWVTAISTAHQPATTNTLGRMSLDFNLRGSYGAIKTVLAELLTRDAQQAVLQQLSLRRAPGAAPSMSSGGFNNAGAMNGAGAMAGNGIRPMNPGGDLEARVVATWLSRPLAESATTGVTPQTAVAAPRAAPASGASAPMTSAPAVSSASAASSPMSVKTAVASAPARAASAPKSPTAPTSASAVRR
ncbi:hypothetical protein CDN99_20080 [Roseateles aquatilis]|uniref:Uncharacterized protein n=1 Tax=Roseateles aquatilis TaxID=431061 RepID=A0A246J319_9BURK|nr:hypothetical protein [Roseateles aquatilis]OWQ86997.1 hypothetical protein CDN99_20080 [Roseateles aquatilis]